MISTAKSRSRMSWRLADLGLKSKSSGWRITRRSTDYRTPAECCSIAMSFCSWIEMQSTVHRRQALFALANGFGGLALAHLLATDAAADSPRPEFNGGLHHPAKARRVIQLFMNGGASQMDTFDYKPELAKRHGQKFDPGGGAKVEAVTSVPGNVMKSPFEFAQHGGCGRWVSFGFPPLG